MKYKHSNVVSTDYTHGKILSLDYGLNVEDRIIYLDDSISIMEVSALQEKIKTILAKNKTKPITLQISSYGGDAHAMFGIIDIINKCPVPINTTVIGPAMSAASLILAAGTGKRTMSPNSIVMIHQVSNWLAGTAADIMNGATFTNQLQEKFNSMLAYYTKKDINFWKNATHTDLYLTPEKCVEYGVVDGIEKTNPRPPSRGKGW